MSYKFFAPQPPILGESSKIKLAQLIIKSRLGGEDETQHQLEAIT